MRILKAAGSVLAAAGVAVTVAGGVLCARTLDFVGGSRVTVGTVADLAIDPASRGLQPVVQFMASDGTQVRVVAPAGRRSSAFVRGRRVRLRYDPDDPTDARVDGFFALWLGVVVWGAAGLTLLVSGTAIVRAAVRNELRPRWLLTHGRPVSTEFQAVTRGAAAAPGLEAPYRIITRWRDPSNGVYYTFESEELPFDPEPYAGVRAIIVRIDPRNPRIYLMDTGFLPRERFRAPPSADGVGA